MPSNRHIIVCLETKNRICAECAKNKCNRNKDFRISPPLTFGDSNVKTFFLATPSEGIRPFHWTYVAIFFNVVFTALNRGTLSVSLTTHHKDFYSVIFHLLSNNYCVSSRHIFFNDNSELRLSCLGKRFVIIFLLLG